MAQNNRGPMTRQMVLITGATSGIGKATVVSVDASHRHPRRPRDVRPRAPGADRQGGRARRQHHLPDRRAYIVNTEFRRQGQMSDMHQRQYVTVIGDAPAPVVLTESPREVVVDGVRVELGGDAVVGERSDLQFAFTDATTGEPIDSLQPFLAAAGHVVVMRADGTTFAHEHAEVDDSSGRTVFAMPGTSFGPELDVHAQFDTAGTYQLWGQFRTADGDVLTVPFTVDAR